MMPKGKEAFSHSTDVLNGYINEGQASRADVLDGVDMMSEAALAAVGKNAERMYDISVSICDVLPKLLGSEVKVIPPLTVAHKTRIGNLLTHYEVIKKVTSTNAQSKPKPSTTSARKQ